MTEQQVTRDDPVNFRKVTWDTFYAIAEDLKLKPEQEAYVSSNALSIGQASFNPGAWYRAIYAGDVPIGFFMLFDPLRPGARPRELIEPGDINLWRFMVDARYQGMGFGTKALDLIIAQIREMPDRRRLTASFLPGEHSPEVFYVNYGFRKTGRMRSKGREVEIDIEL